MQDKNDSNQDFYKKLLLICLASLFAVLAYIAIEVLINTWLGLKTIETRVDLSNIFRNYAILFFGVFAGLLAIWARWAHQKQLKHTEKQVEQTRKQLKHAQEQIKFSFISSRNDRFAKASGMLGKNESPASHGGGLYMLRDLIAENPETEYIRCAEVIAHSLREKDVSVILMQTAIEIFEAKRIETLSSEDREKIIKKYKEKYSLSLWPDFRKATLNKLSLQDVNLQNANLVNANLTGTNLQNANLMGANLRGANLEGANLEGANLTKALITGISSATIRFASLSYTSETLTGSKIEKVLGLTARQIIGATWKGKKWRHKEIEYRSPKLLNDLMQDPEVQEWLKNPPFLYKHDIGER